MVEAPNEWIVIATKDVVQKVVIKVFKVQWYPVLIPFQNGDYKTILKNLKQQFMSVIKLKPNLCTTYIALCKKFGRRDRETDRKRCCHWILIPPS